jgi:hypothetical protein
VRVRRAGWEVEAVPDIPWWSVLLLNVVVVFAYFWSREYRRRDERATMEAAQLAVEEEGSRPAPPVSPFARRTFLESLERRGVRTSADFAEQPLEVWARLAAAPAGCTVCWWTIHHLTVDHVYSSWLDVYVAWPPGRVPSVPGYLDAGDGWWLFLVLDSSCADADTWTRGSRLFSRRMVVDHDVDVWTLVPPTTDDQPDAQSERKWQALRGQPRAGPESCGPPRVVVPLGEEPSPTQLRGLHEVAARTGTEVRVEGGWTPQALDDALTAWTTEILGRPDISFECHDCDYHR